MSKLARVRYLGDLQRLEVKPGDTYVLSVPVAISREQVERLKSRWSETVGDANKLIILSDGMRLGVIGKSVTGQDAA